MDVAPDADSLNFVDNLEEKTLKEESSDGAWNDIYEALDRWSQSILDAESLRDRTEDIRLKIENSIHRQQIDGFLSHFTASELRYVGDLWIRLLHAIATFDVGCTFTKRDILTLLLELYTLNQLNRNVFVETFLKLW